MNAPADAFGQSPAHLAACGGQAFFLLWQLQTGANLNQQVQVMPLCFFLLPYLNEACYLYERYIVYVNR